MYNVDKKLLLLVCIIFCSLAGKAQSTGERLAAAYASFEKDSQLRNAISSLYVIEAQTGKVVFSKNETVGLAPASTQKVIVGACAYEVLGKDFTYKTEFGYTGAIQHSVLQGRLYIKPSGDPTLGSWRWKRTAMDSVMKRLITAIQAKGFSSYSSLWLDERGWEGETIPGGWVWDDIGNYYGAGAGPLNWHENQYDLILSSGKNMGDEVTIRNIKPYLYNYRVTSYVKAAAKGTGDRTIIYFPAETSTGVIRGTIPVAEDSFVVSGAMPSAARQFAATLADSLFRYGIRQGDPALQPDGAAKEERVDTSGITIFHTEVSPPLDSIIYWYFRKSINLYGEALAKTIGFLKTGKGNTSGGVEWIKGFWQNKGIAATELNMADGSGLSPLARVTTHAQVSVLAYARKQPWFSGFYNALPEYNGMKMKSGTISGVKGFCGYQKAANGKDYIFSFLVNNYNGSSGSLISKMYKVLDTIK